MWVMGLQLLGVASIAASLNFVVTIINLRAPGMTMMRMPVFTWMTLVTAFLIILAFPAITIALVELMMDRLFGTNFFEVSNGGHADPLDSTCSGSSATPEVYILILPAHGDHLGNPADLLAQAALRLPDRRVLRAHASGSSASASGATICSRRAWARSATAAFSLMTMAIAVPTGVKIFNWIGTLWGGHLRCAPP